MTNYDEPMPREKLNALYEEIDKVSPEEISAMLVLGLRSMAVKAVGHGKLNEQVAYVVDVVLRVLLTIIVNHYRDPEKIAKAVFVVSKNLEPRMMACFEEMPPASFPKDKT